MKILVVSGFLGAGKTTFIKMLTQKTGKKFIVLENDYAQADIDSALLRASTDLNIYELTEGCVCCSMKQDFASSILTISNTLDPEYLVVEPTGVAKLSNIINNIRRIQYEQIILLKPVTMLDGKTFTEGIHTYGDIFTDQLVAADKIIVTKMEQSYAEELQKLEENVRYYNTDAKMLMSHYSEQPTEWWNSLFSDYLDEDFAPTPESETEEKTDVETLSLTSPSLASPIQLIKILEGVVSGVFGSVIRAKGFLTCGQTWLSFDVVDKLYSITGIEPTDEQQARCVFIGKDINHKWLHELLQPSHKPIRIRPKRMK
ncbi:CobW family GTP-binding protein [Scatolibacter rhodanostii]|uniref:CobW family GTP-binding protein n=1 Tax=Scatolibacter rhodanostii TaxID=2014781 RepID=UPI000C07D172|nr:GTP-binding protein [Scatolibacter rhodanostii]